MEDSKEFEYKGENLWWDKNTRAGLVNLVNSTSEDLSIIINNKIFKIPSESLKNILA